MSRKRDKQVMKGFSDALKDHLINSLSSSKISKNKVQSLNNSKQYSPNFKIPKKKAQSSNDSKQYSPNFKIPKKKAQSSNDSKQYSPNFEITKKKVQNSNKPIKVSKDNQINYIPCNFFYSSKESSSSKNILITSSKKSSPSKNILITSSKESLKTISPKNASKISSKERSTTISPKNASTISSKENLKTISSKNASKISSKESSTTISPKNTSLPDIQIDLKTDDKFKYNVDYLFIGTYRFIIMSYFRIDQNQITLNLSTKNSLNINYKLINKLGLGERVTDAINYIFIRIDFVEEAVIAINNFIKQLPDANGVFKYKSINGNENCFVMKLKYLESDYVIDLKKRLKFYLSKYYEEDPEVCRFFDELRDYYLSMIEKKNLKMISVR